MVRWLQRRPGATMVPFLFQEEGFVMATQKQIEANRENARKSTGPKTEAGKAASSANALSHGLTANDAVVLVEEEAEDYDRLQEGVIADLEPAGVLQAALAQRVAVLLWRLGRVARLEAELFHHGQLTFERDRLDQVETRALTRLFNADQLGEEAVEAREKRAEERLMINVRIDVEAPRANVLVNQQETARAYDQLARHEAMLQRALNRTLAEFRRLREASGAAARSNAAASVSSTHPEPAPSGDGRPPALQGPRTSARSAHAGDEHDDGKALLQNEANSAQPIESTEESGKFEGPAEAPSRDFPIP